MRRFNNYIDAEKHLIYETVVLPDFLTINTFEKFGQGFILENPNNNKNGRSNYEYAQRFFEWLLTGEKELPENIIELNPWVKRFVDTTGLPNNFSSSYGWKIQEQITKLFEELVKNKESRRGYLSILQPQDHIIREVKTTHEYPCTIGLHFFIREDYLHLMVNMRSNNLYSVMPYDVYNFTSLQIFVAGQLDLPLGHYYHQINSGHVFKGDARRWLETFNK